jgi:hypothetical protein
VNLRATINTSANERSPALLRNGHLLFVATDRPGGVGGLDIRMAWRAHTDDNLAGSRP